MASPRPPARLAPSLLSADFGHLARDVHRAEAAGADAFHLDVMDGDFVPNISFGPGLVRAVRAETDLPLDIHLMIQRPVRHLEAFARAGGTTLVFHREAVDDPFEAVRAIRALGCAVGVAIKPETPVARIAPIVAELDELMVMSVHPGFSGQRFLPEALPKLEEARRLLDARRPTAELAIDGGINVETASAAARAGATFFVCGQSVFGQGDVAANLSALRQAVRREEGR